MNAFPECSRKVYSYLRETQIKDNEEKRELFYRHESKGGWPFSTAAHGWPISDCTAEGLKGVLALHKKWKVLGTVTFSFVFNLFDLLIFADVC